MSLTEENDPLGLMALWSKMPDVPLGEFLAGIDLKLMMEIVDDLIGDLRHIFEFFNSKEKPLMPREFLKFYKSLSKEEQTYYMNEIMVPQMQMTGIQSILEGGESGEIVRWI